MSGSSFDFGSLMGGKSGTVDDQPPASPLASSGSFGAFRGGDGKKYYVNKAKEFFQQRNKLIPCHFVVLL